MKAGCYHETAQRQEQELTMIDVPTVLAGKDHGATSTAALEGRLTRPAVSA